MKFLARSLGLLLVAAGFVGLVIDGTRSIVNNAVSFAPIGKVAGVLFPGGMAGLEGSIAQRGYPWLWDPIVTNFLQLPASLTGFVDRRAAAVARPEAPGADRLPCRSAEAFTAR